MKAGDRYKYQDSECYIIWEYTGNGIEAVILETNSEWKVGDLTRWEVYRDEYLGNFSKSNNFSNLYDLLQG